MDAYLINNYGELLWMDHTWTTSTKPYALVQDHLKLVSDGFDKLYGHCTNTNCTTDYTNRGFTHPTVPK